MYDGGRVADPADPSPPCRPCRTGHLHPHGRPHGTRAAPDRQKRAPPRPPHRHLPSRRGPQPHQLVYKASRLRPTLLPPRTAPQPPRGARTRTPHAAPPPPTIRRSSPPSISAIVSSAPPTSVATHKHLRHRPPLRLPLQLHQRQTPAAPTCSRPQSQTHRPTTRLSPACTVGTPRRRHHRNGRRRRGLLPVPWRAGWATHDVLVR